MMDVMLVQGEPGSMPRYTPDALSTPRTRSPKPQNNTTNSPYAFTMHLTRTDHTSPAQTTLHQYLVRASRAPLHLFPFSLAHQHRF